ncbi:MAG: glycosyltransferase family 39 protein [Blastocatellia bacterium]
MRSDLWYDEAYSLTVARQSFGRMMHLLLVGGDTNPPLYTLSLHFWLKFGGSDIHVKLFSLLFGVASIPTFYFLARLVAGRSAGLLSCLLLATSESAIIYSVEARPYALFLLLSILSTYLLLLALKEGEKERGRRPAPVRLWTCYSIVSCLLIYTHWFGLLVILVQTPALVIYSRRPTQALRLYAPALLATGCCCVPLAPFLRNQIKLQNAVGGFYWPGNPSWHSLVNLASFLAGGKNLLFLTPAIFTLALAGRKKTSEEVGNNKNHLVFFAGYLLLPIIVICTASLLLTDYSFFVPRYFLPFVIAVYMLLALALARVGRKLAVVFLSVFILFPFVKAARLWRTPETPYSRMAAELPQSAPTDVLIAHLSPMSFYSVLHYSRDGMEAEKVLWSEARGPGYVLDYNVKGQMLSADSLIEIDAASSQYTELWVIVDPMDSDPKVKAPREQLRHAPNLSLESQRQFAGVQLEHYKRPHLTGLACR